MKTYSKRATLESLQRYEHYLVATVNGEHQKMTRAQVAELVQKAVLIQSPGEMLKYDGYLLLFWIGKRMIYLKRCENETGK